MTYEIGQLYQIPHVRGAFFGLRRDWPVLGPEHEDLEFINFPHQHYHIDYRFVPGPALRHAMAAQSSSLRRPVREQVFYGAVLHGEDMADQPVLRPARFLRQWPEYPRAKAKWLPALEAAYAEEKLRHGRYCPHRGADLSALPADAKGCATCPLHGLRWNLATGEMAR
jgi:hypothetical protein